MKKRIVHFIPNAIFASGYINFMKQELLAYNHAFFVPAMSAYGTKKHLDGLIDEENVLYWNSRKDFGLSAYKDILFKADKIVISGFFGLELICIKWRKDLWNKTYIQLWGGDFYCLRESPKINKIRKKLEYIIKLRCFKKCQGFLFLLDTEKQKFIEITGLIPKTSFVVQVPSCDAKELFVSDSKLADADNIRIVIGNSATKENQHLEVFEILREKKNENISIFCPLVYGDEEYRDIIIANGLSIFGDKFHPITDWMNINDYYDFLSTCDIGIYNNDRQQGLGNIQAMLELGKKVFLRQGTSMWSFFTDLGIKVFPISEIRDLSIKEIGEMDSVDRKNNMIISKKSRSVETIKENWLIFLRS